MGQKVCGNCPCKRGPPYYICIMYIRTFSTTRNYHYKAKHLIHACSLYESHARQTIEVSTHCQDKLIFHGAKNCLPTRTQWAHVWSPEEVFSASMSASTTLGDHEKRAVFCTTVQNRLMKGLLIRIPVKLIAVDT